MLLGTLTSSRHANMRSIDPFYKRIVTFSLAPITRENNIQHQAYNYVTLLIYGICRASISIFLKPGSEFIGFRLLISWSFTFSNHNCQSTLISLGILLVRYLDSIWDM
jgi:hypothetical protein